MLKYLIGILLVVGFSSCKKLTEIEATGLVRDAATQAPLDGAVVSLYEDNDDPFMGNHLLQEVQTDGSGKFRFDFEYKEGPYKIFVTKPGYRYSRTETDKILGLTATFEFQEIAPLENEQYLVFDMAPQTELTIKVKNVAPALPSDEIKIEVGRGANGDYALTRTFEGIVDLDLKVGNVDGSTFVPLRYSVRENNAWRTVVDSIAVPAQNSFSYSLNY